MIVAINMNLFTLLLIIYDHYYNGFAHPNRVHNPLVAAVTNSNNHYFIMYFILAIVRTCSIII